MEPKQGTHWEGCHEVHPECAAYREGFRAGMRRAVEICEQIPDGDPDEYGNGRDAGVDACLLAILAEADK